MNIYKKSNKEEKFGHWTQELALTTRVTIMQLNVEFVSILLRCKLNMGRIGWISREPDLMKTDWLGPNQLKKSGSRIGGELDPQGASRPLEAYALSLVGRNGFRS